VLTKRGTVFDLYTERGYIHIVMKSTSDQRVKYKFDIDNFFEGRVNDVSVAVYSAAWVSHVTRLSLMT